MPEDTVMSDSPTSSPFPVSGTLAAGALPGDEPVESTWRRAARLFFRLMQDGTLSRTRDAVLCRDLEDEGVRAALRILEEEGELQILETTTAVYAFPALGSQVFGFSNQELRQRLRAQTNDHLALSCFAILALLSLFYRGEGFDAKSRDFVSLEDWHRFLSDKLQGTRDALREAGKEAAGRPDPVDSGADPLRPAADPLRLNLPGILAEWEALIPYDETKSRLAKAASSQVSLLAKVLLFLQEEDLVRVEEERIIYPTPRLDAAMANASAGEARRAELARFLAGSHRPAGVDGDVTCR